MLLSVSLTNCRVLLHEILLHASLVLHIGGWSVQVGVDWTGLCPGGGQLVLHDLSLFVFLSLIVDLPKARVQEEIHWPTG